MKIQISTAAVSNDELMELAERISDYLVDNGYEADELDALEDFIPKAKTMGITKPHFKAALDKAVKKSSTTSPTRKGMDKAVYRIVKELSTNYPIKLIEKVMFAIPDLDDL